MAVVFAFFAHVRKYDWLLAASVFLLVAIGLISLYSLSATSAFPFFRRQLVWAGIGGIFLILASFVDFRLFRTQSAIVFIFYLVSVLLLAAILVFGARIRGVKAWFQVGGIALQPVELSKLALVILLAKFFSKRHIHLPEKTLSNSIVTDLRSCCGLSLISLSHSVLVWLTQVNSRSERSPTVG